jgi:uncharacterized protein YaiE (UPF0345 family)
MKTDIKGCSACPKGQEQFESFRRAGRKFVQYDFRTESGKLFSCVAGSLQEARKQRDSWQQRGTA